MTDWADVRSALARAVEASLDWPVTKAYWETEPAPNDDTFARLSVVSDTDEGERAEVVDPDTLETKLLIENRAQVQILFESCEGEASKDLAETCRRYFKRRTTHAALAALGIALVAEPGPSRSTPYTFEGNWVDATIFEIPIRFSTVDIDPNADPKPAIKVGITSPLGAYQVDKP